MSRVRALLDAMRPPHLGWAIVGTTAVLTGTLFAVVFWMGYTLGHAPVNALRQEIRTLHQEGRIVTLPDGTAAWRAPQLDTARSHLPTSRGRR